MAPDGHITVLGVSHAFSDILPMFFLLSDPPAHVPMSTASEWPNTNESEVHLSLEFSTDHGVTLGQAFCCRDQLPTTPVMVTAFEHCRPGMTHWEIKTPPVGLWPDQCVQL